MQIAAISPIGARRDGRRRLCPAGIIISCSLCDSRRAAATPIAINATVSAGWFTTSRLTRPRRPARRAARSRSGSVVTFAEGPRQDEGALRLMAVTYSMKRKQWRDVSDCAHALGEIAVEHILRSGRYLIVKKCTSMFLQDMIASRSGEARQRRDSPLDRDQADWRLRTLRRAGLHPRQQDARTAVVCGTGATIHKEEFRSAASSPPIPR